MRINQPVIVARRLLERKRETYSRFSKWIENAVNHAILYGWQRTVFGWTNWVTASFNPRSLRNFHMQANGAEMLRLACCLGIERGMKICAPVHDAVLIESPPRPSERRCRNHARVHGKSLPFRSRRICFAHRIQNRAVSLPLPRSARRTDVARSLLVMPDLDSDPFLDSIRVTAELAQKFPGKQDGSKPSKKTRSERFQFYKLPVEVAKNALAICHKSAAPMSILLALYEIHFRDFGDNPVRLSSKILTKYGISRYRKYRALADC